MNYLISSTLEFIQRYEFPHKLGLCDRILGPFLKKHGIDIVNTGAGLQWKLDLRNCTDRWILYGYYDPAFLPWAKNYLPKDGIVVESGANIGQMTMYLGQYVPDGKLFAFEPGKMQADWLEECLAHNKEALSSVILCRNGLGEKSSSVFLKDNADEIIHGGQSRIDNLEGEPVNLITLSEFIKEQNIDRVDLWKLDVEGYEIPALKGANTLLSDHKIGALYVELTGDNGKNIRQYLKNFNYQCYEFKGWRNRLQPEIKLRDWCNGLFLPV